MEKININIKIPNNTYIYFLYFNSFIVHSNTLQRNATLHSTNKNSLSVNDIVPHFGCQVYTLYLFNTDFDLLLILSFHSNSFCIFDTIYSDILNFFHTPLPPPPNLPFFSKNTLKVYMIPYFFLNQILYLQTLYISTHCSQSILRHNIFLLR